MDDRYNYTPGGMPQVPGAEGMPPTSPNGPQQPYSAPMQGAPQPQLAQAQKPANPLIQTAIIISLALIAAIAIGLLVWTSVQLNESRTDVSGKIAVAAAEARQQQADADEAVFAAREKEPNYEFTGPEDYGRLTFRYPRTWSLYVAEDAARGGKYVAYFNPRMVGPVSDSNRFALRVVIYDRTYDEVVRSFNSLVESRKLTSSVFQVGEKTGVRLDGAFSNDITGSAVLLKINDKTAYIRTDTEATLPDFETLITTINYN